MRRPLLAALLFLGITAAALAPIRSYDAFWNFAAGRWIVEHRAIPVSDPLAVASAKTAWINGEWLWQIVAYGVVHAFGESGASWFTALTIAAIFTLAFWFASRQQDFGLALVVAAVAFAGASDRLGVRPLTAASLLLVIALAKIDRPIVYAILTVVWINTHPSALLAPLLALLAMRWISAGASAVALLVNPYGWRAITAPFHLTASVTSGAFVNAEWQVSPIGFFPLLYASIAVVAIWFLVAPEKRANLTRMAMFVLLAALAVRYVRNQGLYFAALPLLVPPRGKLSRNLSVGFAIAAIIPVAWAATRTEHVTGADDERFPVRAVARLRAARLGGNVYNVDQFGGYLEWTFHPERRVLTDGRNELFADFIAEDAAAHRDSRAWHALLAKYNADLAVDEYSNEKLEVVDVASHQRRLLPASLVRYRRRDWALIAFDDAAMIFARRAAFDPARLAALEYRTLVPDDPSIGFINPQIRALARQEVARAKREIGDIRIVRELEKGTAGD